MPARPPALSRLLARSLQTSASTSSPSALSSSATASSSTSHLPPLLAPTSSPLPTTPSAALALLRSQTTPSTGIYCLARLHSRTYLLHPRDVLTVPLLKPLAAPGSTLQLTRILEVGSREHAIRSPAADGREIRKQAWTGKSSQGSEEGLSLEDLGSTIPPWVATCELTVLEHTKSPLTRTELKKRRKGYKKTIENKQGWTRLRVGDIVLGDGIPPAE